MAGAAKKGKTRAASKGGSRSARNAAKTTIPTVTPEAIADRNYERRLHEDIASYTHDPLGFVDYAFPWGEPDTPLADYSGPLAWQVDVLEALGEALRQGTLKREDAAQLAIQIAIASGHGIGKSAFIGMVVCWAMATCPDARGIITAGTEGQLRTKTQPEVAKWFRMMICGHWFEVEVRKIFHKARPNSWRFDFIPWNEKNPEAFAGLHNLGRRVMVLIDEASQVARIIWETIFGALTDQDTELILIAPGNPTRNDGQFFDCFNKDKHRWIRRQIDSRKVEITNKAQIAQWEKDYGEDSDFFRVRVRGVFPRAGENQLISADAVEAARTRTQQMAKTPCIITCDPARFGEDETVISIFEGDRLHPQHVFRGVDLMFIAGFIADMIIRWKPDAVVVDEIGMGAGVVDRLHQLGHKFVTGVKSSDPARDKDLYHNLNAEMWGETAKWLERTGIIPDEPELAMQLTSRLYFYDAQNRVQLEKKADMKKRGQSSPDRADSLVLRFAVRLPPRDILDARRKRASERRGGFDVFDSI